MPRFLVNGVSAVSALHRIVVFDWFAHAWMRSAERTFFHEIPDMVPNYLPWNAIFEVPWAYNLYKTLHSLWTKNLFSRYLGEKPLHNCFWLFVDLFLTLSIAFYYFPKSKGTIPIVFRIWHLKRNLGHLKKNLKKVLGQLSLMIHYSFRCEHRRRENLKSLILFTFDIMGYFKY